MTGDDTGGRDRGMSAGSVGEVFVGPAGATDPAEFRPFGYVAQDGLSLQFADDDGRAGPSLGLGRLSITLPFQPGTLAAFVDSSRIVIHGILRQCEACRAPAVDPFPADWRMEIAVRPPARRPELIPHRPDCTAPRPEIALPGVALYDASPPP